MGVLGVAEESYYTKVMSIKFTDKQKQLLGIMSDILDESRSAIVRRLVMAEAKRCAAMLEGEELELWSDLINQIEKEEDLHEFVAGEAVAEGRRKAYLERTGIELDDVKARKMTNDAIAQRNWHRKKRIADNLAKLKEIEDKYAS